MRLLLALVMTSALAQGGGARAEEARAVSAWLAGEAGADARIEALYAQRPWDDDLAWWLARVRLGEGRCAEAAALLMGRDGDDWPSWQLRLTEGLARACAGDAGAVAALTEALASAPVGPARAEGAAALALLRLAEGQHDEAARWLREAGGDTSALSPPLRAAMPAEAVALTPLEPGLEGQVLLRWRGGLWAVDLSNGLGLPAEAPPTPALPAVGAAVPSLRSQPVPCEGGLAWTSPAEALAGGAAGAFLLVDGAARRLDASPEGAVDEGLACGGGQIFVLRRSAGASSVLALRPEPIPLDLGPALPATLHARADGALLLGVVVEGEPALWWVPPGQRAARPLLAEPARAAGWR